MSSGVNECPKLSVVAQFDDMCRLTNSLVSIDENGIQMIIKNTIKYMTKHFTNSNFS